MTKNEVIKDFWNGLEGFNIDDVDRGAVNKRLNIILFWTVDNDYDIEESSAAFQFAHLFVESLSDSFPHICEWAYDELENDTLSLNAFEEIMLVAYERGYIGEDDCYFPYDLQMDMLDEIGESTEVFIEAIEKVKALAEEAAE